MFHQECSNNGENVIIRQTMYLIRHGVAYHNLPFRSISKDGKANKMHLPNKQDPRYTDSKLVLPIAHQQARKAGQILKKALINNNDMQNSQGGDNEKFHLDGVIVSPLSRCLETAYFVVDELIEDNEHKNKQDQLSQIHSSFPWICKEDLREAFGIHYSDKRSCKSNLQDNWPFVQFDEDMPEADEQWKPDRRESINEVNHRIDSFLCWLSWIGLHNTAPAAPAATDEQNNNDTNINTSKLWNFLVVSHGVWMECLFKRFYPQILHGGKRVHNCDVFRADLVCQWKWKQKSSENDGKWKCHGISLENVSFLDS